MPFKSKSQARYLYANEPEVAKKFQKEAPVNIQALPNRVEPEDEKDRKRSAIRRRLGG